jgi:hypothetical protein
MDRPDERLWAKSVDERANPVLRLGNQLVSSHLLRCTATTKILNWSAALANPHASGGIHHAAAGSGVPAARSDREKLKAPSS